MLCCCFQRHEMAFWNWQLVSMSYNAELLKTSEDELDISTLPTQTLNELQLDTAAGQIHSEIKINKLTKSTISADNVSEPLLCRWNLCTSMHMQKMFFDGSVQERRNSSVLEMELRLSCTSPSISSVFCWEINLMTFVICFLMNMDIDFLV